MTSEQGDEYRREIVRRLEQEKQNRDAKRAELEQAKAKLEAEDRASAGAMLRAQAPSLLSDICPSCWIKHGRKSKLHAVQHEDPDHYDRMQCRSCDYFEDREI
jgi:DNA repair exonuclease SbcCD ATPase subunit